MSVTGKQKHFLRGCAHELKVVVALSAKGVSKNLVTEVEHGLEQHELLKIKLPGIDRVQRAQLLDQICDETGAENIQLVGRTGVIFRAADPPRIKLPT